MPRRAGWYHDFFCEDGTRLEVPADLAFASDEHRCPACGRARGGERLEAARRWFEHSWLAAAAFDCALVSVLEDSAPHGAKAAEILLKIAAAYPGRHTGPLEGGLLLQTLDEAVWLIPLAHAYDLLSVTDRLSVAESRAIAGFLREAAAGLRNAGTRLNWGSWHLAACGVAGYATGDLELAQWAVAAFKEQISAQLGDDGLWPESVHAYHFYPLAAFLHLAEAARHRGVDLYRWQSRPGKHLRAMLLQPLQYMYPDFRLPAINDGWFETFLPPDPYELAYARYGDNAFGWVVRERSGRTADPTPLPTPTATPTGGAAARLPRAGFWAFLHGVELPPDPFPAPAFASADFGALGIATLRAGNEAMLTFDHGPFLAHGHLDRMGITLWAHGRLRAADYGTPGYGVPITGWYRQTEAHNTIVVDGRDQAQSADVSRAVRLGDPYLELVEASTAQAYPGVAHTRTVVRAGTAFVVRDRLEADAERTFEWFLRGEGRLIPGFATTCATPDPALPYRFGPRYLLGTRTAPWTARWEDDAGGLAVWMDASAERPAAVGWGTAPAESAAREVELVTARRRGRWAEFLAVLAPYAGAEPPRIGAEAGVLRVEWPGGVTDRIALKGVAAADAALATDGRAAAVRTRGEAVERSAVVDGRRLEFRGTRLR